MTRNDPQVRANAIRELVGDAQPVRRLGIELLRATASDAGLTIRARQGRQVLVAQRGAGWDGLPPETLARELAGDLVAAVFATPTPPPGPPMPARPARSVRHAPTT